MTIREMVNDGVSIEGRRIYIKYYDEEEAENKLVYSDSYSLGYGKSSWWMDRNVKYIYVDPFDDDYALVIEIELSEGDL